MVITVIILVVSGFFLVGFLSMECLCLPMCVCRVCACVHACMCACGGGDLMGTNGDLMVWCPTGEAAQPAVTSVGTWHKLGKQMPNCP